MSQRHVRRLMQYLRGSYYEIRCDCAAAHLHLTAGAESSYWPAAAVRAVPQLPQARVDMTDALRITVRRAVPAFSIRTPMRVGRAAARQQT